MMRLEQYRFPGEFEPHRGTWLLWPSRGDNWRHEASVAQHEVLSLAKEMGRFEPVRLGVPSKLLGDVSQAIPASVTAFPLDFDDTWVRDTGPTILIADDAPPIAVDWRFNSWGGLFNEAASDDAVAGRIAEIEGLPVIKAPMVLEGGAIISNGQGVLISTRESVLKVPVAGSVEATSCLSTLPEYPLVSLRSPSSPTLHSPLETLCRGRERHMPARQPARGALSVMDWKQQWPTAIPI
jgi:agmatine/peptidylarginine deiminase